MKLGHDEFSWRDVGTEARLLLIGIPVFIWTMLPIYHMFLFAISPKEDAFSGKFWPDHPTLHNFHIVFYQQHYFLRDFWIQFWNSMRDRGRRRRADAVDRNRGGVRDLAAARCPAAAG